MTDMHKQPDGIPNSLRWVVWVVQVVGFPAVVALCMMWYAATSINKMSETLVANTVVLSEITRTLAEFRLQVQADHRLMVEKLANLEK